MAPKTASDDHGWGRRRKVGNYTAALATVMITCCPALAAMMVFTCDKYNCAVTETAWDMIRLDPVFVTRMKEWIATEVVAKFTWVPVTIVIGWIILQALLYVFVPGRNVQGELTPDGRIPMYRINGLECWVITHVLFVAGVFIYGTDVATAFVYYQIPIFLTTNIYGFVVSALMVIRAYREGPKPGIDRVFSSSFAYDFLMGNDLHPRIGEHFDMKIFHNSHVGMMAWSVINLSYLFKQHVEFGDASWGMYATNLLQLLYILDFFWMEDWYLKTIDIALDHFGWYLCWGITNWLPVTYTLQAHYLAKVSPQPALSQSLPWAVFGTLMGLVGYFIFRSSNSARNEFRRHKGQVKIWGTPATHLTAHYQTLDGKKHTSLLLTSGFWGLSRHFNYVGDLILSFAYSYVCGFTHLLPHFYIIYMTILLVHRIYRDDLKCKNKYGKYWDDYCAAVPYKLLPGVF